MLITLTPLFLRTVGFCYVLKHEVDDLEEAWGFAKKDPIESDEEENKKGMGDKTENKKLKAEDLGQANTALQAHMIIVAKIKKKIDQELFMAEAAATGGWAAVSVLENKSFAKITGASGAEKELKMQRIRKAVETAKQEDILYKRYERKPMKRPGQLRKFDGKSYGNYAYGGHNGGAVPAYQPATAYQSATAYGHRGRGGYTGYDGRGAGGLRGGARPARACHRWVTH